ncbi:hypothetical protein [uncultured Georgenia sp.]|uniref:hypothetical protein n=1 Tax=uncultured Georgenia sp. TaxID=378209 RepID=UPI002638083E|nr:hypothetical protein [uncultured Georgenia sp.]HLV03866.1 hypothetical protein [Actinomycetaceae bacterium]
MDDTVLRPAWPAAAAGRPCSASRRWTALALLCTLAVAGCGADPTPEVPSTRVTARPVVAVPDERVAPVSPGTATPEPFPAPHATTEPAGPPDTSTEPAAGPAGPADTPTEGAAEPPDRDTAIAQICAETELLHGWVAGGAADAQVGASVEKIWSFNIHQPGTDGLYYAAEALADAWQSYLDLRDTELGDGGQGFVHAVESLRTECTLG